MASSPGASRWNCLVSALPTHACPSSSLHVSFASRTPARPLFSGTATRSRQPLTLCATLFHSPLQQDTSQVIFGSGVPNQIIVTAPGEAFAKDTPLFKALVRAPPGPGRTRVL